MWYRVNNRYFNFHTPRDPRARPLVDGESREPSERFSGRLFPFLIGTERRPSAAVGFREGRRRLRIWSFRRPGGSGMEQASSDAAVVLFFLRKEKEKNGGAKTRAGNARPYGIYFGAVENREPTIPPSRLRRATSLYTREASAAAGRKRAAPSGPPFRTGSSGCFPAGRRRRLRL